MTNIVERHGDNISKAIRFIDDASRSEPEKRIHELISSAGAKFNLTPNDEEYLARLFKNRKSPAE